MKVGIIDADFIGRKNHRFPNLVCMKISGYYRSLGSEVILLNTYENLDQYDKVYISKVFTDTPYPEEKIKGDNILIGGTGFYFNQAPDLPKEIEHNKPDYHLYDEIIDNLIFSGRKRTEFKEYKDYSIGYLTRGCFRKCGFCVNQKYNRVYQASPLSEFLDPDRSKICLLDDNFLGFSDWRLLLEELRETGKPFKFKQGLDERLLTQEKINLLFTSKYDGEITFAFDRIEDYDLISEKLNMIREVTDKRIKFYVLCGYDDQNKYDPAFWKKDLINTFRRIDLLGSYKALPYIMRFNKYQESPYRGIYILLAQWINQPSFFKTMSLYDYLNRRGGISLEYYERIAKDYPEIVNEYFFTKLWGGD